MNIRQTLATLAGSAALALSIAACGGAPEPTDYASCQQWAERDAISATETADMCEWMSESYGWNTDEIQLRHYQDARDEWRALWDSISEKWEQNGEDWLNEG